MGREIPVEMIKGYFSLEANIFVKEPELKLFFSARHSLFPSSQVRNQSLFLRLKLPAFLLELYPGPNRELNLLLLLGNDGLEELKL